MANRYWVGGTGANWNTTSTWSASSGGASGASIPTSSDNVFFDANSGGGGSGRYSISTNVVCNNIDCSAQLSATSIVIGDGGNGSLTISGNATFSASQQSIGAGSNNSSLTFAGSGSITSGKGPYSLSNGITISGTYSLNDTFTTNTSSVSITGSLTTNNQSMSILSNGSGLSVGSGATFNMGSSTVTINAFGNTAVNLNSGATINAGTSTIQIVNASVISLNSNSIYELYLPADVNYSSSTRTVFSTSGTIRQIDVVQGVTLQSDHGTTLTITNCNLVGTSGQNISWNSNVGGSQFNLCVTNQNITYTVFTDVDFSCTAGVSTGGSCTSNCTNVSFPSPSSGSQFGATILTMV